MINELLIKRMVGRVSEEVAGLEPFIFMNK